MNLIHCLVFGVLLRDPFLVVLGRVHSNSAALVSYVAVIALMSVNFATAVVG